MSRKIWGLSAGFFLCVLALAAQPEFTVTGVTANAGENVDINVEVDD